MTQVNATLRNYKGAMRMNKNNFKIRRRTKTHDKLHRKL